jgi:hypothetical protein
VDGQKLELGTFPTEEAAARAYDRCVCECICVRDGCFIRMRVDDASGGLTERAHPCRVARRHGKLERLNFPDEAHADQ